MVSNEDPRSNQPVFLIGTSGWTYAHWKGCFYPQGLPKSRWFEYYAGRFAAVEINATFYRTFQDQTYQMWKERAPQGFGYVLKAPKRITHRKYLVEVAEDIAAFWRSAALLEEHLEMVLLQMAPATPYDLERLRMALLAFPDPARVAVEFRKACWYTPETEALLRSCGAALCAVDSPRQALTPILTGRRAYLRLHGREHWYAYNYSHAELLEIASLARDLAARGAEKVYIFFNNDFEGYAPANALALRDMLGA